MGMGRELAECSTAARAVFARADAAVGISVSELCFLGPEETLRSTENAQPAIVATSLAALAALRERVRLQPFACAGHSLGEYAALAAAGALDEPDAVRLVRTRGMLMAACARSAPGAMAAVLGLDAGMLERLCAHDEGIVVVANYNSPDQAVISGDAEAVQRVSMAARAQGARRVVALPVSGAFHSPLMRPAQDGMAQALAAARLFALRVPVIANVTAQPVATAEEVRDALVRQVTGPVRWTETMARFLEMGVDTFVELGPGKVLTGLAKRMAPQAQLLNVADAASLEATAIALSAY